MKNANGRFIPFPCGLFMQPSIHTELLCWFLELLHSDRQRLVLDTVITFICSDPQPHRAGETGKHLSFCCFGCFFMINLNELCALIGLNYHQLQLWLHSFSRHPFASLRPAKCWLWSISCPFCSHLTEILLLFDMLCWQSGNGFFKAAWHGAGSNPVTSICWK